METTSLAVDWNAMPQLKLSVMLEVINFLVQTSIRGSLKCLVYLPIFDNTRSQTKRLKCLAYLPKARARAPHKLHAKGQYTLQNQTFIIGTWM